LINSIGNLGGAVGPAIVGWMRTGRQSYTEGLLLLTGALLLQALLISSLRLPPREGAAQPARQTTPRS